MQVSCRIDHKNAMHVSSYFYVPYKAGDQIRTGDVQLGKLAFYH